MKTRHIIFLFIIVVAFSARTMGLSPYHSAAGASTSMYRVEAVMAMPYDTLNRDVVSRVPARHKVSHKVVPVMTVPKPGDFNFDFSDDDDDMPQQPVQRRIRTNMTDAEWVADMQMRVDSVARKTRSYQKSYTVTTGRGRHKKKVTKTKTIEQDFTIGCSVYDLTADSIIYSLDADRMMKPASTQKLFTAVTFLADRGNKFEFNTTVTTNGKVVKDDSIRYLKGDIYVKGCFDPTLDKGQIHRIARAIERMQIDSIDGRIIADGHRHGALSIGASTSKNAALNFVTAIARELQKDSILFPVKEPWVVSSLPTQGKTEITTITTELAPVLQRMLKRSNNEYAEAVMNNICRDNAEWSYDHCREAVMKLVRSLTPPRHHGEPQKDYSSFYNIVDGSGLSHSNRTSAEAEVMLLRYAFHNSKVFRTLYDNLPIAGVDGTIGRRLKDEATYNNVRAKTGTIDGVSTLAGYVTAANGHMLAFSILVNETTKSNGHNVQDDICRELAR